MATEVQQELEGQIEAVRTERAAEIDRHHAALRVLREREDGLRETLRLSRGGGSRKPTAEAQAGRHMGEALSVLRRARSGRLSQAEVGRRGRIGTGTLTHSMKALEENGLARRTGEFVRNSPVFELTDEGRRSKITRRPPGS